MIGRSVRTTLYPGEAILPERVSEPGAIGGLTAIIPDGMRAVTLRVDDTISVGGFVRPGHRVDVLTTVDFRGERDATVTKVILQNVQVLATGQEIDSDDKDPKITPTVTVLVNLEQAERLALAANSGKIRLALRNSNDVNEDHTPGISLCELIPRSAAAINPEPIVEAPKPAAPAPRHRVEVYRGSEKSEVTFAK